MIQNIMLFIVILGLFIQMAGNELPHAIKVNKEIILQGLWLLLFFGFFFAWNSKKQMPVFFLKKRKN